MEEKIFEMVRLVSNAHTANTIKLAEKKTERVELNDVDDKLHDKIDEITRGLLTMFSNRT